MPYRTVVIDCRILPVGLLLQADLLPYSVLPSYYSCSRILLRADLQPYLARSTCTSIGTAVATCRSTGIVHLAGAHLAEFIWVYRYIWVQQQQVVRGTYAWRAPTLSADTPTTDAHLASNNPRTLRSCSFLRRFVPSLRRPARSIHRLEASPRMATWWSSSGCTSGLTYQYRRCSCP